MTRTLAPGHVDAWFSVTETRRESDIADAIEILSDSERERQARFVFARDRRDYAEAHALLRRSLSQYADVPPAAWRFDTLPGGKPILVAQGSSLALPETTPPPIAPDFSPPVAQDFSPAQLSFNLSHTRGLVACAVAAGADVGIDVESADRSVDHDVAGRYFSAAENEELQRLAPADRPRRFFELWTLKEAYIKAIGRGLSHPLTTVAFDLQEPGRIVFKPALNADANAWEFALFSPTARHCMAVAVRRGADRPSTIEARSGDGGAPFPPVRLIAPAAGPQSVRS